MGELDNLIEQSSKAQQTANVENATQINGENQSKLEKYCSICKIVVNVEVVIYAVAAIVAIIPSFGLSILGFGLLYILTIVPQYLIIEIGKTVSEIRNEQNK